ncbi:hypothetical protein CJP74_03540 [Psittacicella melopsittaci]|uniref:Uncharacterized protein n=1 Tax=Psittacicella melopsittaci TaxID=2028576 RepID=A0A3A1Y3H6_9GAMM|nr:hypothetical protein [Psittacicella melopsittaci]RIY32783.1 hypothetical protein CJP74_03540 [Psittacicella melopsittaci]
MKIIPYFALALGLLALSSCDRNQVKETNVAIEHSSTDALDADQLSSDFCNNPSNAQAQQCQYTQALEDFDPIAYINSYTATYVDSGVLVKVDRENLDQVLPRIRFTQPNPFFNPKFDLYKPVFLALATDFANASDSFYYEYSSDPRLSEQIENERQESAKLFYQYYGYRLPQQELTNFNFSGLSVNYYEYPVALLFRESNNLVNKIVNFDFANTGSSEQLRINQELLKIMLQMAAEFYAVKIYNQNNPEQLALLKQNGFNIDNDNVTFTNYLAALYTWTQQGHWEINPRDPMFARVDLAHLQQICPKCQFLNSPFDYQFALNRMGSLIEIYYLVSLQPEWQAIDQQAQKMGQIIQLKNKEPEFIDNNEQTDAQLYAWLEATTNPNRARELNLNSQYTQDVNKLVNFIAQNNYFYLVANPQAKPLILKPVNGQTFHYDYSFLTSK